MTTKTPYVVRSVTVVPDDVVEVLRNGQSIALAIRTADLPAPEDVTKDYAGVAWDRFVDKALEDAAPEIAEFLQRVIEKRLPWTWEGEDQ